MFYRFCKRNIKKLVRSIFFKNFIIVITESVLQLTMASYLFVYNKFQPDHNKDSGTPILNTFTWFTVIYSFSALLLVISFSTSVLMMSKDNLASISYKRKLGYLYESLKSDNQFALSYYLIFLVRRMILCAIFLGMQETPA
jgi:hypothetical protein